MKLWRLEIYLCPKESFTSKEKEELGIIDLPQNILNAYKTINQYNQKTGENHNYLLSNINIHDDEISPNHFKEIKQQEKEDRKRKLEEAQKKARDFKDYQRRERLGLLTPEELEHRALKKLEKKDKWLNKRNK